MTRFIVHEQFNPKTRLYDIAILNVHPPFKYSGTVKPIKIAEKLPPFGSMLKVSGWGEIADKRKPKLLQTVELPLLNPKVCKFNNIRKRIKICIGYKSGPAQCKVSEEIQI